jgi:hypothetical protein
MAKTEGMQRFAVGSGAAENAAVPDRVRNTRSRWLVDLKRQQEAAPAR